MCEASAYIITKDGQEKLLLEDVDLVEPTNGEVRLVSIYGEQKVVKGRIKSMSLVNHRLVLEEMD